MIRDAVEFSLFGESIKVARPEDIIGLKLQALCNSDPGSREQDAVDIRTLIKANLKRLDWTRIEEYYKLLQKEADYRRLKEEFHV